MRHHFIDIKIAGKTVDRDLITYFKYDDSISFDSMLEFRLEGGVELKDSINSGEYKSGKTVIFSFGIVGGTVSENHVGILVDMDSQYKSKGLMSVTIRVFDKGTVLKRSENTTSWDGYKASDIVKEIAAKYNLGYEVENTTKVYKSMPQAGYNDFEFIKYLASLENGFIFYLKANSLYFKNRNLDTESKITYTYGADDAVLNFTSSFRDSLAKAETNKIETTDRTKDKSTSDKVVSRENVSEVDMNLGEFDLDYLSGTFEDRIKRRIVVPEYQTEEVTSLTDNIIKETKLKTLVGTLLLEGDPIRQSDEVITLAGDLLDMDMGNWYVERVVHTISGMYTTQLNIAKNAITVKKDALGVNPSKSANNNKSVGAVEEDYITLVVYDAVDGKPTGYETKAGVFIDYSDKNKINKYTRKPVQKSVVKGESKEETGVGLNVFNGLGDLLK